MIIKNVINCCLIRFYYSNGINKRKSGWGGVRYGDWGGGEVGEVRDA